MDFDIAERYLQELPEMPPGLIVPEKFTYIHFKAYSYLTMGPDAYRNQDAFGLPPVETPGGLLAVIEHGCQEIWEWKGISSERPIEGLGIRGFYRLMELFHFEVIEQCAQLGSPGATLDIMTVKHVVTGEEITLYNLV